MIHDVSVPLRGGMVTWPGDAPFAAERVSDIAAGDKNTLSALHMGAHSGTHVDAPAHFLADGETVDRMPLGLMAGRAKVIGIEDRERVTVEELERHSITSGDRVLFRTRNGRLWADEDFATDFVHLSTEAARWLADRGVALVGIDYLSVGGYKRNGSEVHRALLGAGVWLVEGLDLSAVEPGEYEMLCLPLRVEGAEGAPARVLLRTLP